MPKIKATLLNGVYVYKGRFFRAGEPEFISKADMEHLKEHAVLRNKANGKVFLEQKFNFEMIEDDAVKFDKKMDIKTLEDLPKGRGRKPKKSLEDVKSPARVDEDSDSDE